MLNSNPETVSTDYDSSDRLYFEPLTFEDVLNVIEAERPEGVIVQFGGQTPLKLAMPLLRWLNSPAVRPRAHGSGERLRNQSIVPRIGSSSKRSCVNSTFVSPVTVSPAVNRKLVR